MRSLINEVGADNVIATDVGTSTNPFTCKYEHLDVCNYEYNYNFIIFISAFDKAVKDNKVNYIIHSAAILSAAGEKDPNKAIPVNVNGTINAFNIARDHHC